MFSLSIVDEALEAALEEARKYVGATAPNPPVGAAALSVDGEIVACAAHQKAGQPHAEAALLSNCDLRKIHSLVVTLEPCNHYGRTPPCTEKIIEVAKLGSLKTVYYGVQDPNPLVAGRGAARLQEAGLDVVCLGDNACAQLIAPFAKWMAAKRPWVTLKTAYDAQGSMIPPPGHKTFSSPEALKYAHVVRKRCDAIITGSGTVLADLPEFTVRHVFDHPGKSRWLVVLDRRGRMESSAMQAWRKSREAAGFRVTIASDFEEALEFLGRQGVLEVLVEAGPTLTETILRHDLWDSHIVITPQGIEEKRKDAACLLEL